jgi:putative addiction module CopG family antidote
MAVVTLNISVSEEQAAWVRSRKEGGDFASASDVVRDLIRREREKELNALEADFEKMDKRDGAKGPEPVEQIVAAVRKVRKKLLQDNARDRRA